ncbi:MAG: hypothetical protein ACTHYS_04095 [Ancrocorticia populi]|uniref:hypothetical protein n=1 Tax=Ancrocorticia populi TaxID=2175228 RepID=UPI00140346B4|nr:hypothetical protein [Ancrocorticia populi]
MYGLIWRALPGPKWLKFIEALILILVIVGVLFEVVFPWVAANIPAFDNTVG